MDGGVVTVPWGWDLASPGGGSRGHCWPVCWPWRCWPCLVSGPSLVSLMPMLTLLVVGVGPCVGGQWLVVGGGSLVMPLVRVLQAMSRVMSSVRVVLVAPLVWVPLVTVWCMGSCAVLWWRECCCLWFRVWLRLVPEFTRWRR